MNQRTPVPHVVINMAMSADGKITTRRREPFQLGTRQDKQMMNVLRARSDAVIIGSRTCRVDGYPLIVRDAALVAKRRAAKKPEQPLNVIMSGSLDLPLTKRLFLHPGTRKVVFTLTAAASDARVKRVAKYAEVVILPGKTVSPKRVVTWLARQGCRQILVEGGGEINYSFLKARLVDELYITVTPTIIGGAAAPTIVDGHGFLRDTRVPLVLVSARKIGHELFLRYQVAE